ncbi:MAG TPA: hypothetical protein VLO30_07225 [Chthoniobacterales bacterium]|nr:hypothetical protein [Chthoniobacterales bacterium]
MAVAPEHYPTARLAFPRLPLWAILGFALFGVGGSAFLAYTSFSHGQAKSVVSPSNEVPVYSARAVPFDSQREDPVQRADSIARALTVTQTQARRAEAIAGETPSVSAPTLLAAEKRELRGFTGFSNFVGANNFLTFTGTSFGISAQNAPSGFVAPDAETLTASAVPETSTWLCGGALLVLVAVRGAHASWHRHQRRAANRGDSRSRS